MIRRENATGKVVPGDQRVNHREWSQLLSSVAAAQDLPRQRSRALIVHDGRRLPVNEHLTNADTLTLTYQRVATVRFSGDRSG